MDVDGPTNPPSGRIPGKSGSVKHGPFARGPRPIARQRSLWNWSAQDPSTRTSSASWTTKMPLRRLMKDRLPKSVVRGSKTRILLPPWPNGSPALSTIGQRPCLSPARVGRTQTCFNPTPPASGSPNMPPDGRDNSRPLWTILSFVLWSRKIRIVRNFCPRGCRQ
jgi:hypothetical protein